MSQTIKPKLLYLRCIFTLFVTGVVLSGCATPRYNTQNYTVKSGDTLYFIAWKYRLDPQELALWNNLRKPYAIRPGDKIQINPFYGSKSTPVSSSKMAPIPANGYHLVKRGETLSSIARKYQLNTDYLSGLNRLHTPFTIFPGDKLRLKGASIAQTNTAESSKTTQYSMKQVNPTSLSNNVSVLKNWYWPLKGKIVKSFKGSKSTQQGIDIAGEVGQKVLAAAAGEVVYSGEGPALYGQMVIIKHNSTYLSAYGYNSSLLVKEGDIVRSRQPIARVGLQASKQPQLHFEIRKYGKPVNPVNYLPRS